MDGWTIEAMRDSDWQAVSEIYQQGIDTGEATFETAAPEWPAWDAAHRPDCRLVARAGDKVGAWAALSAASRRPVYAGVAEVSIYVAEQYRGQGLGRCLLTALVRDSEAHGIWTLQAGIFASNAASIALHRSARFRMVGQRERIAQRGGRWRDTVLMERRSEVVGL
jgi:L-amino acid N-acyltransferase YncA